MGQSSLLRLIAQDQGHFSGLHTNQEDLIVERTVLGAEDDVCAGEINALTIDLQRAIDDLHELPLGALDDGVVMMLRNMATSAPHCGLVVAVGEQREVPAAGAALSLLRRFGGSLVAQRGAAVREV